MNLLDRISYIGTAPEDNIHNRYIRITNRVSLLLSGFFLVSFAGAVFYFGLTLAVKLALSFAVIPLTVLLFNHFGLINFSRIFLAITVCVSAILMSILDKALYPNLVESQYFEYRVIILAASILPFILFSLNERKFWISTLSVNLAMLLFYDPIHELFHFGFYQVGLTNEEYPYQNFVFACSFSVLAGCTYFLKRSFEKYEVKSHRLIKELSAKQKELEFSNLEIERQRKTLAEENLLLNRTLIEKNNQLVHTNEALIQHNHDLQQFSYTVSHNLRGPVASLLGLLGLTNQSILDEETNELLHHIKKSASSLDTIIKDLGSIIDIRNSVSQVKQHVAFQDEVNHIRNLLQNEIKEHDVSIISDFTAVADIYSMKPMVNSILYNLISNSIKYRSRDRKAEIKVISAKVGSSVKISVADNGLGLDIERFKEKLFGMYKRFHSHVDGKGLGLFLVKLQAESLGGQVQIESVLGKGTTIDVVIPNVTNPDHQIIMDQEWGRLYYDALEDTTVVVWKRALTVSEFLEFYQHCVDFSNSQLCANWIVEIKRGTKIEENNIEYQQARLKFANELKRTSLKRLGYVISEANEPPDFEEYKKHMIAFYQGKISFFRTIQDAQIWIASELKKEKEVRVRS